MDIRIRDEYIRLGQALKLSGAAQSGVEAKMMISDGAVQVNGETELRRGRKLRNGDSVTVNGVTIYVHSDTEAGELPQL